MKRLRAVRRNNGERKKIWPHWNLTSRVVIALVTWAALCAILLGGSLFPGRFSLKVGEESPILIRAPRMAQYVDQDETERLREEAARRVAPQYSPLRYSREDAERRVAQDFALLEDIRTSTSDAESVKHQLDWIPDSSEEWLLSASRSDISRLEAHARSIVRALMSKEIREGTADLDTVRIQAETMALQRADGPEPGAIIAAAVKRELRPNRRLDREAMDAAQAEARDRVQEVVRTIDADHAIVFEGERVTREHLDMLQAVGLSSPQLDYRQFVATVLIVGMIVLLLGLQTRHWEPDIYERPKRLLLLSLLTVAPLFVVNLLTLALPNVWMLFVPAAALMAAALLADALGIIVALALSLLVGMMGNGGLIATLLSLGSAGTALAFASQLWPMSRLRVVVGTVSAANLVLVIAAGLLNGLHYGTIFREAGLAAGLYSPGAAVLALGGIYVLQRPFGITTHLGLLELLNPQVPLLKRLHTEAPGTYHHCFMVANLAEAAAEVVGADTLLTRVGALYHDIGKLYRPSFFVENQALLGVDNVHDRLSSSLSGLIIVSHVKDGVALGRANHLPPQVIDIIAEHHGSTTVSYFYQQALASGRPQSVSEDQFRYPGPTPGSKESALVMLADAVHAAAKSIPEPTPQRVQQMVREIFRERVVGGQLQRCDLTFGQLAAAEDAMGRVLTASLCRNRIAYPEPIEGGVGM